MPAAQIANPALWNIVFFGLVGVAGLPALMAVVSPRTFARFARQGNQWFDSSKALACLDKRVDIDEMLLPFSRYLGAAAVVSLTALGLALYWR